MDKLTDIVRHNMNRPKKKKKKIEYDPSRRAFLGTAGYGALGLVAGLTLANALKPEVANAAESPTQVTQTLGQYQFEGTITDLLGNVQEGVTVRFYNQAGEMFSATTDETGHYSTLATPVEDKDDFNKEELTYSAYNIAVNRDGSRTIKFSTPRNGTAKIRIFNSIGQLVDESNPLNLGSSGQYEIRWDPRSKSGRLANGFLIAQVEIQDEKGTHFLPVKLGSASGDGAGFQSSAYQSTANFGKAIYTENRSLLKPATGVFTMEVEKNGYITHRKLVSAEEGTVNNLGISKLLDDDADTIKYIDETVRKRGFTVRWVDKPDVYINIDRVGEETKQKILDYLTTDSGNTTHNSTFKDLTNELFDYKVSDIHFVGTADMPELDSADNMMLFDNEGGGSNFEARGRTDGSIKATLVNLTDNSDYAGVLNEMASCLSAVGEYEGFTSMHNDRTSPPNRPTTLDLKGYHYLYDRAPRTISPDNEPGA